MSEREMCWSCRRPRRVCWCEDLRPVSSQIHVLFLQHPNEARVGVSTCRMAHRSLPNSEMYVGVAAEEHDALLRHCAQPDTVLLYPADDAVDVRAIEILPRNLVVVDGTWSTAKKLAARSPALGALPKVRVVPPRPGTYRIRKEPFAHGLSTIEAVAFALDALEGPDGRFQGILHAFDAMVERQLAFIATVGARRHRRRRSQPSAPIGETVGKT